MITQTAEYALRAVVYLSQAEGPRTAANIAEATQVPSGYMSKVLQSLARAGVVASQRGPSGGFVLADSPRRLSIYKVILAIEPLRRFQDQPPHNPSHKLFALYTKLDSMAELLEDTFKNTVIADLH